jgi:deoxycytidylate deaminase
MRQQHPEYLGYYPEAELVFGIVCPLGTPYGRVVEAFTNYLRRFGYQTKQIQISDFFNDLLTKLDVNLVPESDDAASVSFHKIKAGNAIREAAGQDDVLALVAASAIADSRQPHASKEGTPTPQDCASPRPLTAHLVCTLRRPEEVATLRRIYGRGFFLVGVNSSLEERKNYLDEKGINGEQATLLIRTDAKEKQDHGQATRDAFQMADVFLSGGSTPNGYLPQISRFLDLVFGCPSLTPTPEEQAMFMAYAASLRSGDLSRQVGAAIVDARGDLISVGCNEVPRCGGGLYDPPTTGQQSHRDIERGDDSNDKEKNAMAARIVENLGGIVDAATVRSSLKSAGFFDITEFGRSVHAEMEALLACARSGRSAREATLFTTTFPCHNCTRHIIAAGIRKVVYIEPYAKSRAAALHSDAISVDCEAQSRIPFLPFVGIGPRRYFDLFSLTLSTGYPVERKLDGKLAEWSRETAPVRLQIAPSTYLQREALAFRHLQRILSSHV